MLDVSYGLSRAGSGVLYCTQLFTPRPLIGILIEGKMATDDEVGLLEEQYTWKSKKQKTETYGTRPRSVVGRLALIILIISPFVAFFLGIIIGPYWTGRLDVLCLERTSIPCKCKKSSKPFFMLALLMGHQLLIRRCKGIIP